MTQEEKAKKYDELVAKADIVNRELSKLKSANAGIGTTSDEYEQKIASLKNELNKLENSLKGLFVR